MEKTYGKNLNELRELAHQLRNTPMIAKAKVEALAILNLRYEMLMVDRNLPEHPYPLTAALISDTRKFLEQWHQASRFEDPGAATLTRAKAPMEAWHQDLFQQLWVRFSRDEYEDRIERYVHRLRINGLADGVLKGARVIDFGCGHGNFLHACLRVGAASVHGIDYGEGSIEYAKRATQEVGVSPDVADFQVASVYKAPFPDASFDFAIQNGVFHHLDDEAKAYREAFRVLKPGGWFWVYTDGSGAISHELWDASLDILKDIPQAFVLQTLKDLNLETGKRYHLSDGLNAIYRHDTWANLTERLGRLGFGKFRRLTGGFPTDFDHDAIAADRFGADKFGEGDLRLLTQKAP
jgi:ubiquinone/menaquinone biosynthesis C-methylase UbiE